MAPESLPELGYVPTYVYRFHAEDGEVLYVGVTRNLNVRVEKHRNDRPDEWHLVANMTVEVYGDRYVAENVERVAILRDRPRWNKQTWYPSPRMSDEELEALIAIPTPEEPSSSESVPQPERPPLTRVESAALIYEAVALHGPLSVGRITALVDRSRALVLIRLAELIEQGRIVRDGYNRWTTYRVPGEDEPPPALDDHQWINDA